MRLLHCHIENFGKLSQLDLDFTEGLNVLLRENGFGKSTLAAFFRAMFYGFSGDRKQDITENERKHYAPWQGGAYGGELSFEISGKKYRIERYFGDRKAQDHFALYDEDTNLPSADYTERIGEEIFQINEDSFLRTVYIAQDSRSIGISSDIHAKLGQVSKSDGDMGNYELAEEKLNGEINRISPIRKTGSIFKLRLRIEELSAVLINREKTEQEVHERENRLPELRREREKLKEHVEKMESKIEVLSRERDQLLKAMNRQREEENQRLSLYRQEIMEKARKEAEEEAGRKFEIRIKQEKKLSSLRFFNSIFHLAAIFFLLLFLASLAVLFLKTEWNSPDFIRLLGLEAAASILFFFIAFLFGRKGHLAEIELKDAFNDREDQNKDSLHSERNTEKIDSFTLDNEKDRKNLEELKRRIQDFEKGAGADLSSLHQELKMERNQIETISGEILKEEEKLQNLSEKMNQMWEAEQEKLLCLSELQELEERYGTLKICKEYLRKAKEQFSKKYMEPTEKAFRDYYQLLLGNTDGSLPGNERIPFRMDANLNLHILAEGRVWEPAFLSRGYQDLVSLSLRFAVIQSMYQKEKPFLILDDPFVNLDDDKIEGAIEFLRQCAEEYQILYFSCSESRVRR